MALTDDWLKREFWPRPVVGIADSRDRNKFIRAEFLAGGFLGVSLVKLRRMGAACIH
jgi:hypothetical protein